MSGWRARVKTALGHLLSPQKPPPCEVWELHAPEDKKQACGQILRALPDWFGNPAAIMEYEEKVKSLPVYAAFDSGRREILGFAAIRQNTADAAEIVVMGIMPGHQRKGIGKQILLACEKRCAEDSASFLLVKTLDASADSEPYARTRAFYRAMGFRPLMILEREWDADNPCLLMGKTLTRTNREDGEDS